MFIQNYSHILEKNLFGQNIYSKKILKLKKTKTLGVFDFFNNILNDIINKKNRIGTSILCTDKIFKHKDYKEIKFKMLLNYNTLDKGYSFLLRILQALQTFQKKEGNLFMNIAIPVKGGFYCYSLGVLGFMPQTHIKKILLKFLLLKYLTIKDLATKLFFYKLHTWNKVLLLSFPFRLGKISILTSTIQNNFSLKNKTKKRNYFTSKLNVVFLAQK